MIPSGATNRASRSALCGNIVLSILLKPNWDHSGNDLAIDLLLTAPHPFGSTCFKELFPKGIPAKDLLSLHYSVLSFAIKSLFWSEFFIKTGWTGKTGEL